MKSLALGKLRLHLLAKGMVTSLPVCPTCGNMVTPALWDAHQAVHEHTKARDS
jgi:ribosomal protein L32